MAEEVKLVINLEESSQPFRAPPPPSPEDVLRPGDIPDPITHPVATPQPAASAPPPPTPPISPPPPPPSPPAPPIDPQGPPVASGALDADTLGALGAGASSASAGAVGAAEAGGAAAATGGAAGGAAAAAGGAGGAGGAAAGAAAGAAGGPPGMIIGAILASGALSGAFEGLTDVFRAGTGVARDFFDFVRSQTQEVAPFSPALTQANVEANIQDMMNRIERAEQGGDELASVREEMTELNTQVYKIATELIENLGPTVSKVLNLLGKILELLAPFIDLATWILGKMLDINIEMLNFLISIANMFGAGLGIIKKTEREKKRFAPGYFAYIDRFFGNFISPGPVKPGKPPRKPRRPPRRPPPPDDGPDRD